MIPVAHMSDAKVAPSPFTISGATNSGCPWSILTMPTIRLEREKSHILISEPPGRLNMMSHGVRPRWPMLFWCMYSRPSRICWIILKRIYFDYNYHNWCDIDWSCEFYYHDVSSWYNITQYRVSGNYHIQLLWNYIIYEITLF